MPWWKPSFPMAWAVLNGENGKINMKGGGIMASVRGVCRVVALPRGIYRALVTLSIFVVTICSRLILPELSRTQLVIIIRLGFKSVLRVKYIWILQFLFHHSTHLESHFVTILIISSRACMCNWSLAWMKVFFDKSRPWVSYPDVTATWRLEV